MIPGRTHSPLVIRLSGLEYLRCGSHRNFCFRNRSGLIPNSLFKLDNGQYWCQSEYVYQYKYLYRPAVIITENPEGHSLEVEVCLAVLACVGLKDREPD